MQLGSKINVFPNMSSENCTFTVCFEVGKWLSLTNVAISPTSGENRQFSVSKQTVRAALLQ